MVINLFDKKMEYLRKFDIEGNILMLDDISNFDIAKNRYNEYLKMVFSLFEIKEIRYEYDEIIILINDILFKKESRLIEKSPKIENLKVCIKINYMSTVLDIIKKYSLTDNKDNIIKNINLIEDNKDDFNLNDTIAKILSKSNKLKIIHDDITSFKGEKTKIVNLSEIKEIFESEKVAIEKKLDITDSIEIKRASIIRENIHITLDYPVKSINVDIVKNLEDMKTYFPNFVDVIDDIIGYANLSLIGNGSYFYMKPILLAGDPGVGKTAFAKKLSNILNIEFKKLPFTTISAAWVLTGLDLSWNGGKQGKLFNIISNSKIANPIIFLDELDKAKNSDTGGNPLDTLHDLLEKETSTEVLDEALNIYINLSKVNWIATANDLTRIPESILSRFQIFEIKDIDNKIEKFFVIRNVFKNILNDLPNGNVFSDFISDDICEILTNKSIRNISNILSKAIGRSATRHIKDKETGKIEILISDLNM